MNTLSLNTAQDSSYAENGDSESLQQARRLPCRGCTRRCPLYASCNGTPWRL